MLPWTRSESIWKMRANLREAERAQEIEEELSLKEETILEFEGAQEATFNEQSVQAQRHFCRLFRAG